MSKKNPFEGTPFEDIAAHIAEEEEKAQMNQEADNMAVARLFNEELTIEQLTTLRIIFDIIAFAPEPAKPANFYAGMLRGVAGTRVYQKTGGLDAKQAMDLGL